ncbi:MAG: lysophospholipid acyltransferase family protein [Candidatus Binatia bacterium]
MAGDEQARPPADRRRAAPDRVARRRRFRRDVQLFLLMSVAPRLLSGALWFLSKTVRVRFRNGDDIFRRWRSGEQMILAFWHDRVLLLPPAYRGRKLCIMNSQHRDGEIATRALARWGIRSVRGSATRGGAAGFLQLVAAYRDGYDLAIVPDGPRGPRHVAKPGIVHLARATGAPIVPVTYAARRKRRLHSWDRLIVPWPFTRVVYVAGEPIAVPRDADDAAVEALRRELQECLDRITGAADAEVAGRA